MRGIVKKGGLALLLAIGLAACGGATTDSGSSSGGGGSGGGGSAKRDLSGIGTTPNYATDHASYLVGNHAKFACDTCHTLPLTGRSADGGAASAAATSERQQICATCHLPLYNATNLLNHAAHKIGAYCNSCHYSDNFRTHNRVAHNQYHDQIVDGCDTCHVNRAPSWHQEAGLGGGCADCHAYPVFKPVAHNKHSRITGNNCEACHAGRQPASHTSTRSSGCGRCHAYPAWSNVTDYHAGITSGCNASGCHSRHYSNYDCIWCHTSADPGNAWNGWHHSKVDKRACTACHKNGKGDRNAGLLAGWLD